MTHISTALRKTLVAQRLPVVTEYDLFLVLRGLMAAGTFEGAPLKLRSSVAGREDLRRNIRSLVKARYLRPDEDFYGPDELSRSSLTTRHYLVLRIADVPDAPAEDICCLVDPFAYISHLSAMQRYGLTNRSSFELNITTPSPPLWKQHRDAKMQRDNRGGPPQDNVGPFPRPRVPLERITLPETLRGRSVVRHTTKHPAETRPVRNSFARIAAIGDVFMQMLDQPKLCGGMSHVLEVWATEAKPYVEDIIKASDRHYESIVKVRAGYLLEALLGIRDPRIEAWQKFAQRGGSRRLDPGQPYLATFSEKWMLSLNVESEFLPPTARS